MSQLMPEKFNQAMQRMAVRVSSDGAAWRQYLTATSYLYKYESYEQLLIYGFKTDCTAVADPATWKRLGYSPRQDIPVTQIRLPGRRTLYDVSDLVQTGGQQPIQLWTPAGYEQVVVSQLKTAYQIPDDNSLEETISGAVMSELDRYLNTNAATFEELFGPNMDDGQLTLQILAATLYTVYYRCGINELFPPSLDVILDNIPRYQNPDLITLINHATWHCAGTVLRQIECTVQQERSRTQNHSPRNRRRQHSRQAARQRELSGQIGIENIPDERIVLPPESAMPAPEEGAEQKEPSQTQQEKKAAPAQKLNQAPGLPAAPPPEWKSPNGNRYEVWPQVNHNSPYGIWDTETEKFVLIKDLPIMFYHREHAEIFMEGMERQDREQKQQQAQQNPVKEACSSNQQVEQPNKEVETSEKQSDDTPESAEATSDEEEKVPEPAQELPQQAAPMSRKEIQAAIEAAIQEWNGSNESKHNVVRYMRVHGNEEAAAQWLQQEYGDNLPQFSVPTAYRDITWNRVRRYVDKLIQEDRFFTDAEKDALEDIDPVEVREELAQRGIVDGQVVDEEQLMNHPFILQVQRDVELAVDHEEGSSTQEDLSALEGSDQISIQDYQEHIEDENTTNGNCEPDTLEVEITFSEHPVFFKRERVNGEVDFTDRYNHLRFALANRLFDALDRKQQADREKPDNHAGWYHKTDFVIHAKISGKEYHYEGRYDLGDGDGTLIDHIRAFYEYASRELSKEWKAQGTYEEEMASLRWGQQTFIPYLEGHTELSREDEQLFTEIMATAPEWYAVPQHIPVLPIEATVLSASGVSSDVVDEVLRLGSNQRDSVLRIIGRHQLSTDNFTDFLKQEFRSTHSGGRGVIIDEQKYSVWYNEQGIYITPGSRVFNHTPSVLSAEPESCFRWEQVAARIDALIKEGRYAPQELVDKAPDFQRHLVAESLWYMHQDVSDEVEFFMDADLFSDGFPDSTERITQKLSDSEFLASTIAGLEKFKDRYLENRDIMRWKQYNPIAVLPQILLLQNEPQTYPLSAVIADRPGSFITEDEIDACVRTGNGEHFNLEQYSFIIQSHSIQEIASNLKHSYGIGGASHSVSGAANSWTDYSSKGLSLKRDDVRVKFTWESLAKRMKDMVLSGTFLKADAQEQMPGYERYILARETYSFFSAAAKLSTYPYEKTGDYYRDEPQIQELLKSPDSVNRLVSSMRQALNETDIDLEQFKRLAGKVADVESYANGTYSLFTPCKEIQEEALVHGKELYVPTLQPRTPAQSISEGSTTVNSEKMDTYPQDVVSNSVRSVESTSEQEPLYHEGDSVFLDDRKFIIDSISESTGEVQLRDPSQNYPIFRAESKAHFNHLLHQDERNVRLFRSVSQDTTQPEMTTGKESVYPGDKNNLPYDIVVQRLHFEESEQTPPIPTPAAKNFRITDYDLGAGGPKSKYQANVRAIRTLQAIEAENRSATPEEQEILSRYVGWGGIQEAFDVNKPAWAKEYQELQELLPSEDYKAARASVLNAHFTSPTVIEAMYHAIQGMGFEQGRILEPAMGVGNFFGMLPDSMSGSELHGVELDSVTGRIATLLYPEADITVAGFETTNLPEYYDLAIGNVPFGRYQVNDPTYNYLKFTIHNYFAAKMIDQVRPGGIVAFVTSRYMMDSTSSIVREHLAQRAELLGAIRLPNNAFKSNANTDVVTDILFFQRREHPIEVKPDWLYLDTSADGITLNSYFVQHPEMIMGVLSTESTQYGKEECTVLPKEGVSLSVQLQEAIARLPKDIYETRAEVVHQEEAGLLEEIPADPTVPNYSYCVQDGKVYFKRTTTMLPYEGSEINAKRIAGMVEIRDLTRELIQCQRQGGTDAEVEAIQRQLNTAYDNYVQKNGVLSTKKSPNKRLMREDSSWSLLASLEDRDSNGQVIGKADLFTKRTVRHIEPITSCDNANEALMVCLNESSRVSIDRIMELTGKDRNSVLSELAGRIYRLPLSNTYVTAEEYLSGNVRNKLAEAEAAAQADPDFEVNVEALRQVQPVELTADEISVRLGTPWIPPEIVKDFISQLIEAPWWKERNLDVIYNQYTSEWRIEGKSQFSGVLVCERWGTPDMGALKIIEKTLNQQEIRIYDHVEDANRNTRPVLNQKKTIAAREKQSQIQNAFKDWIFKDAKRREFLVTTYNQRFNATRPRTYDGSHLTFDGMSPEITLMPHQKNAVARALYGGNTLLAHVVGAGKTFEMATIAMEAKRIGITHKSMIVVPNHITEQWGNEFQKLYPGAKLLVTSDQDFTAAHRRQFCTRIATGDWDAVIIGDSQFKMIPMSLDYQKQFYQNEVDELTAIIEQEKRGSDNSWSIKAMERAKRTAEARIQRLMETGRKDSVINFEELGIDRLFIDESHLYKNLGVRTKMANVAGVGAQESSERANDMYMKCRYMDEITDCKGIVFATGTPISNSMSELYTVCKYLAYDRLQQDGLLNFDAWAAQYGETVSALELAPEGTGYRSRTRFAKFVNLPELMSMYHDFADVKLADDLHLNVPEAVYETIVSERSPEQTLMMEELSERASQIRAGVDPRQDNMLKVTNDGRKLGLDQRLIDPTLTDHPDSKVNLCVAKVLEIWSSTREERAAQMIFCDSSTPKPNQFNVYDDIKTKLLDAGVPAEEIAFIHDAKTKEAKQQLFTKVRQGAVRILLGSTSKMGAGTNAQDRLLALHNLDCPWVPSSLEQRAGRIIRQGNRYKQVKIFNYVTNGTFDSYLWQTVENKQRFIGQIMTGKTPVRSCEDVDETALSYAEVKALCIGNPLIKVRAELDTDLTRLKMLKSTWQREQYRLSDKIAKEYPATISALKSRIESLGVDVKQAESTRETGYESFVIAGEKYAEQKDTEAALVQIAGSLQLDEPKLLGEWRGFTMIAVRQGSLTESKTYAVIQGRGAYKVKLSSKGNLIKIRKEIDGLTERLEVTKSKLQTEINEMNTAEKLLTSPGLMRKNFRKNQLV